ncbi:MAG: HAMP domain-containing histidine kinase [Clostridiaceae bacterium]|nr:HAMP domain-containing histidine kinase [Clostridiaceae bacterium]
MHSIRTRLSLILIVCSIAAVLLTTLFVNLAINSTFNEYLSDIQQKRNVSIVEHFQQVYKSDRQWTKVSGTEMMHEAYMSNYCITLLDVNKNQVWGMSPTDIKEKTQMIMHGQGDGVYTSKTFDIKDNNETVGYVLIGQYYPVILSEDDVNFKNSINRGIGIGALVTIIVVSFIGLTLSKQFSKPIAQVSDMAMDLSNGNYETKSEVKSKIRELSYLTASINNLRDKLKEQNGLRKKLVSDISHEIRTPLNILQNNLEAMIDGIISVSPQRLVSLNDEVIRFSKLLDNLQILKQFEADDIKFNQEDLFIDDLVVGVCKDFSIAAREKNIELQYNIESGGKYLIFGDLDKLKQVFINLMSNSIKFTSTNGKMWISMNENNEQIVVRVKDTGMGIKREDIPFIFERLYRGDKSRHEIQGSGLGLTMVKRILDLHSATIKVESEEGKGTEFIIYFNKKIEH